jgi:hypothetical protein
VEHGRVKVALATWEGLPDLWPDDELLRQALLRLGIDARAAVWSDPRVDWASFAMVVLRSTWDYHRRSEEFLRWIDRLPSGVRLLNAPATVRWNAHKSYLRDLAARGVPVVPTVWGSEIDTLADVLRDRGWTTAVIKPAVGANADGAQVVPAADGPMAEARFRELRRTGEVLVQPYVAAVDGPGEHSLIVLEGAYSHTVLRTSRLAPGSPLKDGQPLPASSAELELARRVLAGVDPPPLYARVDVIEDDAGRPMLMELELIEPLLYLGTHDGAADRLAAAIGARLDPG